MLFSTIAKPRFAMSNEIEGLVNMENTLGK